MNEPVTPTTDLKPFNPNWRSALERCEAQVTERDEQINTLRDQLREMTAKFIKEQQANIYGAEQFSKLREQINKRTHNCHKLLNDYRCTLAALKAAIEVAQYELEYVTLNQAKP